MALFLKQSGINHPTLFRLGEKMVFVLLEVRVVQGIMQMRNHNVFPKGRML